MALSVSPTFVKSQNFQVTQITTGISNANNVTCYTGGANGSKVMSCTICANTSVTQDCHVIAVVGGVGGYVSTVSVLAQAGFVSGSLPANGFANAPLPFDSDGNPYLILPSSTSTLQVGATTLSSQWATANAIYINVNAVDF